MQEKMDFNPTESLYLKIAANEFNNVRDALQQNPGLVVHHNPAPVLESLWWLILTSGTEEMLGLFLETEQLNNPNANRNKFFLQQDDSVLSFFQYLASCTTDAPEFWQKAMGLATRFLNHGSELNARYNDQSETPVNFSFRTGNLNFLWMTVNLLGPDFRYSQESPNLLHLALTHHLDHGTEILNTVRFLISVGVPVTSVDVQGRTPLMLALTNQVTDREILETLISEHSVNIPDNQGNFALLMAVTRNDTQLAILVLKHGARADMISPNGNSALSVACRNNNPSMIITLVRLGANIPEIKSPNDTTFFERLLKKNGHVFDESCKMFFRSMRIVMQPDKELLSQKAYNVSIQNQVTRNYAQKCNNDFMKLAEFEISEDFSVQTCKR